MTPAAAVMVAVAAAIPLEVAVMAVSAGLAKAGPELAARADAVIALGPTTLHCTSMEAEEYVLLGDA